MDLSLILTTFEFQDACFRGREVRYKKKLRVSISQKVAEKNVWYMAGSLSSEVIEKLRL